MTDCCVSDEIPG